MDGKSDLTISVVRRLQIPNKHLIIGNGESRSWFKPCHQTILDKDVVTWGCNPLYRDGTVDNLVAVDYSMQQEIYESGYWSDNQCWFTYWSILPSDVADVMLMGYDIPEILIHKSSNKTDRCVISGKDPVTLKEKIEIAIQMNPHLDMKDLVTKMEKDVGVWITYVDDNDNVKNIEFPIGWSTGNTAVHHARQQEAKEVYLLGFDLSEYDKPLNNIYKGTDNYLPASTKGFNSANWMNQLKTVFKEFPDTQFYWVDWAYDTPPCYNHSNVGYLTKTELCDKLNIL